MADFNYKQSAAFSQVLDLVANQRLKEQQIRESQQNVQTSQLNNIRNVASDAASMVSGMVTASREKQKLAAWKDLASVQALRDTPIDQTTAISPLNVKAASSHFPGQSLSPAESITKQTTYGETPEYKTRERNLYMQAYPDQAAKLMGEQIFQDPLDRQKKIAEIEKLNDPVARAKTYAELKKLTAEVATLEREGRGEDPEAMEKRARISNTIRGDFLQQSKAFQSTAEAYQRVIDSVSEPSAAGDMALIYGYMRLLDPTSSVKEGEFATAAQAQGVPARIVSLYNKVLAGERLADNTRSDFLDRSKRIYKGQEKIQEMREKNFRSIAERAKADPGQVVLDLRVYEEPSGKKRPPLSTFIEE